LFCRQGADATIILKQIGSELRARDDHPIGGYVARVVVLDFRNYFADLEVADL
jgi:hypothetical protein